MPLDRALYEKALRPVLFRMYRKDPEAAHELAMRLLMMVARSGHAYDLERRLLVGDPRLEQRLLGIRFRNPVGLAAGFCKDGRALRAFQALGFSHIEVGTATPLPQQGNPRPRMFRLERERAIINRMGFNNPGAEAVARNLQLRSEDGIIVGVSVGKGRETPSEEAPRDYAAAIKALHPYADYVAINVSSPNTPGLRDLQRGDSLGAIVKRARRSLDAHRRLYGGFNRPLLVKVSPDMEHNELDEVIAACAEHGADGIIAVNTTVRRGGISHPASAEAGGLSGAPLRERALETVTYLGSRMHPDYLLVGCGGIMDAEDAYAMLKAGASLVQAYTGFVWGGPSFARDLNQGILERMDRDGVNHVSELRRR